MSSADYFRLSVASEQPQVRRSFGRTLCSDSDLPRDLVEQIWRDPTGFGEQGDRLQEKLRCSVARIDHEDGLFVWKQHNWGSLRRTVKRSLSQSVARRCYHDGLFLHSSGVPTPRPRAYLEDHCGPFGVRSYLLSDYIPGTSLYRFMRYENPSADEIRCLARQVAAIWQKLDELRVWHNDFKTENLLVDSNGQIWLIDLERMRRIRSVDELRRRRVRDAGDLLHPRNWRTNPEAAEVFRHEILATESEFDTRKAAHGTKHPLHKPIRESHRDSQLVTVVIPCCNAASTIAACVESVRDMADEIFVADSGSTDETVEIVRRLEGCRVVERDTLDEISFAAWTDRQASYDWILRVMPDEQVNAELGRQVQDSLASNPAEKGFLIRTAVSFRGRRLKYGPMPDASLRLYHRDSAKYELSDGRLRLSVGAEKVGSIRERLLQNVCSSFDQHLRELGERTRASTQSSEKTEQKPQLSRALFRAPWQMFRSYFLQGGCLDGWAGLHACALDAFMVYLREAMLWEALQPVPARRVLADGRSHGLRLFDPNGLAGSPPTGSLSQTPSTTDDTADEESRQPLRRAA